MPQLWSVFLALLMNIAGFELSDMMITYWKKTLDGWIIVGMIMIGVGLASCSELKTDFLFSSHMMMVRFVLWPLVTAVFIACDMYYLHLLSREAYFILAVISLVPLPGSAVALSATLGLHPDKMAFAVVFSTLLAALIVPFLISDVYEILK
jgi:predicted permease